MRESPLESLNLRGSDHDSGSDLLEDNKCLYCNGMILIKSRFDPELREDIWFMINKLS